MAFEGALRGRRCIHCLGCGREGGIERVADGLKDVPAVCFDSIPKNAIVEVLSNLHHLGVLFPVPGASFYIGQKERDRTAGRMSSEF